MKLKIILGIMIITFSLDAANYWLGIQMGLNRQTCNDLSLEFYPEWKWGYHGGLDFEFFLPGNFHRVRLGFETGLFYQSARYGWVKPFDFRGQIQGMVLNDLQIPTTIKIQYNASAKTELAIGGGLVLNRHLNGYFNIISLMGGYFTTPARNLGTVNWLRLKTDIGFKITPKLKLTSGIGYQINLSPDCIPHPFMPDYSYVFFQESAFLFDLGFTFGF